PQVSQELPFLHPSETSVLNRLCRLGTDYIRFAEFVEQYTGHVQQQDHPSQQNQSGLHGIYLRAFCTGLDSVLQPYRQALLDLEQEFLADPHLSISHVNYSLDQVCQVNKQVVLSGYSYHSLSLMSLCGINKG
ncbi:PREDICTED: gamma-tubulin complex component 4-like, partial [Mesitornis unicolor]|uniref:gamma-tubulin complex component 4-like n=1 Tax=Mesitornis unicolor TaxID=54374 RepID=UPI0005287705